MVVVEGVDGGTFLVTAKSAVVVTVDDTVELLLPGTLSDVVVVTFAVLLIIEPAVAAGDTCATSVNAALVLGGSVAMLHETVAPVVQVKVGPVFWVRETNVVFAGSVSVQLTLDASDGPLFVTVIP